MPRGAAIDFFCRASWRPGHKNWSNHIQFEISLNVPLCIVLLGKLLNVYKNPLILHPDMLYNVILIKKKVHIG